uniref:Putative ovule protein n=1 Tax=Solanum chacoense TaxID=4108 RepID=A0A0V0GIC0_SOLCH
MGGNGRDESWAWNSSGTHYQELHHHRQRVRQRKCNGDDHSRNHQTRKTSEDSKSPPMVELDGHMSIRYRIHHHRVSDHTHRIQGHRHCDGGLSGSKTWSGLW